MVLLESQRNGVEKILVRGDKNRLLLLRVGEQPVVRRAGRKNFQSVRGRVTGGLQLGQSGPREIFIEEKFHRRASGFHAFHGGQVAGKFEARTDVELLERRIILQDG